MQLLKQGTAASILVGQVLDSSGAVYTGMAIGDFNITKNGAGAALAAAATATHDHNGHYAIALTTGNTDTPGRIAITCNKTGYVMPPHHFEVLTAKTFDAIVTNAADAAGGLCDVQRIGGTAQTARDIGASVLLSVGTGTGQLSVTAGKVDVNDRTGFSLSQAFPANFASLGINASGHISRVTLADTITTYTGDTPQTGDSYARIGAAGAGLTALGDTRVANLDAAVSSRLATSGYTAPPSSATIAGAVWDVTLSGHLAAGTTGFALNAAGSAGDPWGTALPGAYAAGTAGHIIGNRLDAATIAGAVWDVTLSGHLTAGSTGFGLNAAGSAGDPWGTALPGRMGPGRPATSSATSCTPLPHPRR